MHSSSRKKRRAWPLLGTTPKASPTSEQGRSGANNQAADPAIEKPPAGRTLADLRPGECATIVRLFGSTQGRLRLLEMGLTPGTHVKVLRAAAFGGPLDIEVRGYQLSLRRDEAAYVWFGFGDDA